MSEANPSVMIHFDRCAPYLEAALAFTNGDYTLDDVRERCFDGRMQFWPGKECAAVTSIAEYPRTKVLVIFLLGGSMREWQIMWPVIKKWAESIGCSRASAVGRPGWRRHRLALSMGMIPREEINLEASLDG